MLRLSCGYSAIQCAFDVGDKESLLTAFRFGRSLTDGAAIVAFTVPGDSYLVAKLRPVKSGGGAGAALKGLGTPLICDVGRGEAASST